ncbi:MAG: acetate--CoA ligase family protein, partial [Burkholderiales bacterium]
SIAIVGASDNPHKVGGRPILYMKRYGFKGAIYPINPGRAEVQGLKAYASIADTPEAPELAVIAVAGDEAVRAVEECAAKGVKVAVVMTSGFGEIGAEGKAAQERMAASARAAGMRLVGPNCQGLANFATGAVANFSTIFHEMEARDGPVAIVSQSGACSQAIYILARQRGLDVRHVHATGNEADVTVADLAEEIVQEEGVRLVLLYMEAIQRPQVLARAAEFARGRDLPIVAVKAGRTASGVRAASSHTGALASEDRVIDAFFEKHAIWRAADPQDLVLAGQLYLSGGRPKGKRFVAVSNSGASCVMAADAAEELGLELPEFAEGTKVRLKKVLPAFATAANPLDVTGALLTDSGLIGGSLEVLGDADACDLLMLAIPIAGAGYDVPRYARDAAAFRERFAKSIAVAAPQEGIRAEFDRLGVPVFARERDAMLALRQLAAHSALLRRAPAQALAQAAPALPARKAGFLDEFESLALLAQAGIAVVEHRLCMDEAAAREAFRALGPKVVVKACSSSVPHKTEQGLVRLGVQSEADVAKAFGEFKPRLPQGDGVLVARQLAGRREMALGGRLDPLFGPVVMVGDGGIYLEALKDFQLLLPPFVEDEVLAALAKLRIAPLFAPLRGQPGLDVGGFARMAVHLGEAMLGWQGRVASVDVNPVMLFDQSRGALAADALVELAPACAKQG